MSGLTRGSSFTNGLLPAIGFGRFTAGILAALLTLCACLVIHRGRAESSDPSHFRLRDKSGTRGLEVTSEASGRGAGRRQRAAGTRADCTDGPGADPPRPPSQPPVYQPNPEESPKIACGAPESQALNSRMTAQPGSKLGRWAAAYVVRTRTSALRGFRNFRTQYRLERCRMDRSKLGSTCSVRARKLTRTRSGLGSTTIWPSTVTVRNMRYASGSANRGQ